MGGHFEFQSIPNPNEFYTMARSRLFEKFKNEWPSEIAKLSSLDNYARFKPFHGLEEYLTVVNDKKHLSALIRLRLHSHNLAIEVARHRQRQRDQRSSERSAIEVARHNQLLREQRLCIYCDADQIEDEIHFLLFCSFYHELRRPLIPLIQDLNTNNAFAFLLHSTAPQTIRKVAKFVYLAFLKRSNSNITRP